MEDLAGNIVTDVLFELMGRAGFENVWDSLDKSDKLEIEKALNKIVEKNLGR